MSTWRPDEDGVGVRGPLGWGIEDQARTEHPTDTCLLSYPHWSTLPEASVLPLFTAQAVQRDWSQGWPRSSLSVSWEAQGLSREKPA